MRPHVPRRLAVNRQLLRQHLEDTSHRLEERLNSLEVLM